MEKELKAIREKHTKTLKKWIVSGDTGTSSVTIWCSIMDVQGEHSPSIPLDYDDFGRCHRLIERFDLAERRAIILSLYKYEIWKPIANQWNYLSRLYEAKKFRELDDKLREARVEY